MTTGTMSTAFYHAILFPPHEGLSACEVLGIGVNGSGSDPEAALLDAASILQEVVSDLVEGGEPVPPPAWPEAADLQRGRHVVLQARFPARAA